MFYLYFLLCSCIQILFGKSLEILAKMLSTNQIVGFLKPAIFSEQLYETSSVFAFWYKFTKTKSWLKLFWLGRIKNVHGHSGHRTRKLTVSQKWTDGINWFFACRYKFRNSKSWFKDFWVGVVKNGYRLQVHEMLNSTIRMNLGIVLIFFWMLIFYSLTFKCCEFNAVVLFVWKVAKADPNYYSTKLCKTFSKIFRTITHDDLKQITLSAKAVNFKCSTYFSYEVTKWQKDETVLVNYCGNVTDIQIKTLHIIVLNFEYLI